MPIVVLITLVVIILYYTVHFQTSDGVMFRTNQREQHMQSGQRIASFP